MKGEVSDLHVRGVLSTFMIGNKLSPPRSWDSGREHEELKDRQYVFFQNMIFPIFTIFGLGKPLLGDFKEEFCDNLLSKYLLP